MKKVVVLVILVIAFNSCKKEVNLTFTEVNAIYNVYAIIEINIPKAEGENTVSLAINSTIENHIANILNFSADDSDSLKMDEAIHQFESEFKGFKTEFEESALVWEALFDGEVIYQSTDVVCVAINGYTNTGGAHGSMNITLYNFDTKTGKVIQNEDLIHDINGFTEVVKKYFKTEIEAKSDEDLADYFFGEEFHLPANIGFNDEGVLILYNVYEIASYSQGITEFTIPFEEVNTYLKVY